MPLTTLALQAPIDISAPIDHPALKWYLHYHSVFDADLYALAKTPTRFYSSHCVNYGANGVLVSGAKAIFDDYIYLWGWCDYLTRDVRSLTVVSDEAKREHVFHIEVVTNCHLKNGKGVVGVPTCFVYTARPAKESENDGGLEFRELRSYLDTRLIDQGKAMQDGGVKL